MALINCPECNKQISDKAEKCPDCGHPMHPIRIIQPQNFQQNIKQNPPQNIIVENKEGCFLQTLNTGCMIIGAIILLVAIFIFISFL